MTSLEKDVLVHSHKGPERRHFSSHLVPSADTNQAHKAQGRRYHPHGHGKETLFRPHAQHMEPRFTKSDLDWKSGLRWLPQPRYSDAPFPDFKVIKFPGETRLQRPFPQANMATHSEWTFYPNFGLPSAYHIGKKCIIDGVHYSNLKSTAENTLPIKLGRKKQVVKSHSFNSEGSKPYLAPEYSPDFHKLGSTLPVPNFGGAAVMKTDTFIPLHHLPRSKCKLYLEKKATQELKGELLEVKQLNEWIPAIPIFQSVFRSDVLRK
ncbi:spermatogenesis-associated serine-rich protein 1 [Amia ocellicauda]|uniref:spermatogenesis-associated serine-rich protein 1 n=1 Tax=Amia ocellicauda TaxID=2972642 RepID=UPI0034646EE0